MGGGNSTAIISRLIGDVLRETHPAVYEALYGEQDRQDALVAELVANPESLAERLKASS